MTRLALVMIARDEARCIARALDSFRGHVDAMLVLDTGSADQTIAIAEGCGARVERFAWRDDFSAARNAALAHADADWSLIVDADEWLEGPAEALTAAALGNAPFIGEVRIASSLAQGAASTWLPRLLPRGVRYEGRVHEQPVGRLSRRRLDIAFGHDGYLPESLERKEGRNEALLRLELAAAPQDAYLWFQLGRERQAREDHAAAAEHLITAYNLCPPDAPYRHSLVVRTLTALKDTGAYEDARALADAEAGAWGHSADFWFMVGDLYLAWSTANPGRAVSDGLPLCEFAWKRCLEIGDRLDLDGAVQGRGGYMAAHNLAVMFETTGLKPQAEYYQALAASLSSKAPPAA